jgi:hypothetical protein
MTAIAPPLATGRERRIDVPSRSMRRYLRRQGRKDGRHNIPDLKAEGWFTPALEELRSEAQHGVRMFGKLLWAEVGPINRQIARTSERGQSAANDAEMAVEEAGALETAASAHAGTLALKATDEAARARRRARAALVAEKQARGDVRAAGADLADLVALRRATAEEVREWTWAFINMVRAAESIYWQANLRARKKSVPKRPENVVFPAVDEPLWLISDQAIEGPSPEER